MMATGRAGGGTGRRTGPLVAGSGARSGPPSPGNTRAEVTSHRVYTHLDWLDFTTLAPVTHVLDTLSAFGLRFVDTGGGSKLYRRRLVGVESAQVEAEHRMGRSDHVRVSLPGDVLDSLPLADVVALVTLLDGKPTRVDLAAEGAGFHPRVLESAWHQGWVRSRVKRANPESFRTLQDGHRKSTVYIGSVNSDAMLRCYNRDGPTRLELQLRRGKAESAWSAICAESEENFPAVVVGAIGGFVDFAAPPAQDSNVTRWTRLPFWEAFLNGAARVRLPVPRVPVTFERIQEHVIRQATAFTTWLQGLHFRGDDPAQELARLLALGRRKQTARQRAALFHLVASPPPAPPQYVSVRT